MAHGIWRCIQLHDQLSNTAILFIDLINDFQFEGGEKLLTHTESILPNLLKLRQFADEQKLPIIYINDHYQLWQSEPNVILNHCLNPANKHIIQQIKPRKTDYFLIKPQHSAFYQTPLHSLLKELGRTHLIIAGIAGDICILFTAKDAHTQAFTLHIPKNCIASEQEDRNKYALYLMESVMKANIEPI
ncbi:isochorismatase family cysteine hydrolase [Ornithinibacillus scapharcae]|uniref:isochorismatase family cysteine hydrolase n=1 Tax=Ornithinibacillus scapharcae TaxID=1147159 RepID=UPI00068023B7|nr:isochorismatase family cysteine hydrolase [Ornithinibacillus scapharcae]